MSDTVKILKRKGYYLCCIQAYFYKRPVKRIILTNNFRTYYNCTVKEFNSLKKEQVIKQYDIKVIVNPDIVVTYWKYNLSKRKSE